jgi:hypothetical protein
MKQMTYTWLVIRALYELARYDVIHLLLKISGIQQQIGRQRFAARPASGGCETAISHAMVLATCLYWKPVPCLQRSVCLLRLLRGNGVAARLVIGYRPVPFLSHAWVEVDGRVVNDSPAYQKLLHVLLRA